MQIYYDGLSIRSYPWVSGFTTNCTLTAGLCYEEFYHSIRDELHGRPISFQIWEDEPDAAIRQIDAIHSMDASIYVKVPIVNSRGEPNDALLTYCADRSIPINVTALYTTEQIDRAADKLSGSSSPIIASVFAGPISDLGVDPVPFIRRAKERFPQSTNVLWAGCREVYTVERAAAAGCDIITVPDGVIERLRSSKTLEDLARERVQKFRNDALKGHTTILRS